MPGYKPGTGTEIVMPKPGIDEELDQAFQDVEDIKMELERYLQKIIKKFDNDYKICYAHILNRYEIEFPIEYVKG